MAGIGALVANIVTTFDPKGINNAKRSIAGLTDASVSASRKQKIAMGLIGGAFAAAGAAAGAFAIKVGRDAVRAAIADEKSVTNLNRSLKNLGVGFQQTQVENFITQMQFATGVSDSQLRPAMNQLVLSTNDVTKAQRILELSLNISASTGRDLESVTLAMSKAALGNFTALTRLGVPLDKTIIKNKDLDAALTSLEDRFQGASAAAAGTMAGKISILTERVGEAQEAIGYDLILALQLASKQMDGVGGLADSITNIGDRLGDFIVGLGYYIGEIDVSVDETNRFTRALERTGQTIALSILGPLYAAIPALGDVFGFVADKGDDLKTSNENNALTAQLAGDRYLALAKSLGFVSKSTDEVIDLEKQEAEALKAAEKAAKDKEQALKELQQQQERITKSSKEFAKFVAGNAPTTIQGSLDAASVALSDIRRSFTGVKTITDESVDKFEELTNVIQDRFSNALSNAESQLDGAKQAFSDFKNSIATTITGTINFASAIEETDFLTGLEAQASKAIKFSERINTLLSLGLSERGIQEVLSAGADAGTAIADQIIAGGSTVVVKVNQLLNSVSSVADQVGQQGASMFYSAGVSQGQALVDGIKASLIAAGAEIANISASLVGAGAVIPPAPSAPPPPSTATGGTPPAPKATKSLLTTSQFAKASNILKTSGTAAGSYTALAFALSNKTIKMARGGIVMGPTNALIGEAGPEAVIPLSGSKSGGLGTTINITVNAGIGTSGSQVGREIVDAIKKYERTSGPVFASA
jgi:DNA-binding transcriptional MerR regulator